MKTNPKFASKFFVASALTFVSTLSSVAGAANQCGALFEDAQRALPIRTFDASKTLSQKVRDNAPDYWNYSRKQGPSYFGELAKTEALVVGDTHPGNFIISPLGGKMRFFIADIKDSGRAPLIYDFARLVLATHAVLKGEVKLEKTSDLMQSAYEAGLADTAFKTPKEIEWIFKEKIEDYTRSQQEYVTDKVRNNQFKKKEGVLEEISFKNSDPARFEKLKQDIKAIAERTFGPDAKVLDYAFRPRERGGSVDMTRYWALVRNNGELTILEFKQVSEPATSQIRAQEDVESRYHRIFDTFWNIRDPFYQIVNLDNDHYLMRPKKTDIFRVPYKLETQADADFTLALARYDAYYLGQIHGRQLSDSNYLTAVQREHDYLNGVIRQYTKDYVDHLEGRVDKANGN